MRFRSIILLFIVALLVNGCKKRMFDARNAYTGSWEFQYLITSKQMGQPEVSRSGTYLGRIYYNGRKDAKGIFWMEYAEGQTEGFELRDKTQIFGCGEKFGQFDTRILSRSRRSQCIPAICFSPAQLPIR
jgi:hypothetical protein